MIAIVYYSLIWYSYHLVPSLCIAISLLYKVLCLFVLQLCTPFHFSLTPTCLLFCITFLDHYPSLLASVITSLISITFHRMYHCYTPSMLSIQECLIMLPSINSLSLIHFSVILFLQHMYVCCSTLHILPYTIMITMICYSFMCHFSVHVTKSCHHLFIVILYLKQSKCLVYISVLHTLLPTSLLHCTSYFAHIPFFCHFQSH